MKPLCIYEHILITSNNYVIHTIIMISTPYFIITIIITIIIDGLNPGCRRNSFLEGLEEVCPQLFWTRARSLERGQEFLVLPGLPELPRGSFDML